MIYTHKMFETYIDQHHAEDEAANYSGTTMTLEEIRADINECLEDYTFEVEEDRENYVAAILDAVNRQRA